MKTITLTIFSVLMVVCLATADSDKNVYDPDYKLITELLDTFRKLDKRGAICQDRFMDIMSFRDSNYCRRRRREAFLDDE